MRSFGELLWPASAVEPAAPPVGRGIRSVGVEAVNVTFGKVAALRDVSLEVRGGEALMLVGPNGAGKSTLVQVLLGIVRPDSGRVIVDGAPVRVDRRLKSSIGYLPEAIAFSENLSGRQVLRFFAHARGVRSKRVDEVLERVGLAHAAKRAVRGYSRGMRQRLGIAIAILAEPPLLVLDEPTGGLDQEGLGVLFGVLSEWREKGRFALVATHDLTLLERRVDRVCVLKSGRRVALDTPTALRKTVGLPVRVTFETRGEAGALEEAIEALGGRSVTREPNRLVIEVEPDRLMDLLDAHASHRASIVGLRVEEPGMDEIYEQLLRAAPEARP